MVQVKLLTPRVGMSFNHPAGAVIDVEAGEAARLVESQQAVYFEPETSESTTEADPDLTTNCCQISEGATRELAGLPAGEQVEVVKEVVINQAEPVEGPAKPFFAFPAFPQADSN